MGEPRVKLDMSVSEARVVMKCLRFWSGAARVKLKHMHPPCEEDFDGSTLTANDQAKLEELLREYHLQRTNASRDVEYARALMLRLDEGGDAS